MNTMTFVNPKVESFDFDGLDMEDGATGNMLTIQFNYDALLVKDRIQAQGLYNWGNTDILNKQRPNSPNNLSGTKSKGEITAEQMMLDQMAGFDQQELENALNQLQFDVPHIPGLPKTTAEQMLLDQMAGFDSDEVSNALNQYQFDTPVLQNQNNSAEQMMLNQMAGFGTDDTTAALDQLQFDTPYVYSGGQSQQDMLLNQVKGFGEGEISDTLNQLQFDTPSGDPNVIQQNITLRQAISESSSFATAAIKNGSATSIGAISSAVSPLQALSAKTLSSVGVSGAAKIQSAVRSLPIKFV
jgi:hypothetical protein